MRVPSVGPLSERTLNDERISSVLHEGILRYLGRHSVVRRAGTPRDYVILTYSGRHSGAKATECAAATKAANLPDVVPIS